jgi:tetratricopeptide (TPR) repeat protein
VTPLRLACVLLPLLPSPALADETDPFGEGLAALMRKDYDKAIAAFTDAVRKNPKSANAFGFRGDAHAMKKDYAKAIADYTTAIGLEPKNPYFYGMRGCLYDSTGAYDKAIADHTEAIRLAPRQAFAYGMRGYAQLHKGASGKAAADFAAAARLEPKNFFAHEALARVLATSPEAKVRDGKRALEHATRACELSGWKHALCVDTLAAAHAECGNFKEAVRWQKKALELGHGSEELKRLARQRLELYEQGKPYRGK